MGARPGNASGESTPAGGDGTIRRSSSSSFSCILSFLPYLNSQRGRQHNLERQVNTWLHHAKEEEARLCCLTKLFGVVLEEGLMRSGDWEYLLSEYV